MVIYTFSGQGLSDYSFFFLVTRFNLADAGDTVEDANFIEINANATILRLHGMIDWTKVETGALEISSPFILKVFL